MNRFGNVPGKKGFRFGIAAVITISLLSVLSFENAGTSYVNCYMEHLESFAAEQDRLIEIIDRQTSISSEQVMLIKKEIAAARIELKAIDFWLRYLDPVTYKKINGPLPVEWESESINSKSYSIQRDGAGLTLSELYLDEAEVQKDVLLNLLNQSKEALEIYRTDSILQILSNPDHFYFANRLFLLNLAAIYTSGFECPDPQNVIPELDEMLISTALIYETFNQSFSNQQLSSDYLTLYAAMQQFVHEQPKQHDQFDHFHFISDFVNPLFAKNQELIRKYKIYPQLESDYFVNGDCNSIFDKHLFIPQNTKGIFKDVSNQKQLTAISAIGKLLFYDPILSGNGKRSCVSCHKPTEYFTDTTVAVSLQFDGIGSLPRNTPSLINSVFNHTLMLDGRFGSLQDQAKDVTSNPIEMGGDADAILTAVMSCPDYKNAFENFTQLTPAYPEVTIDHIVSAITIYYSGFSDFDATFDQAMNGNSELSAESINGFNLFMSKAQCATCHFAPQFNGVKPPYGGNEFEVLGVPADTLYRHLSADSGRYKINPAFETFFAFRTGTIRNSTFTAPYMHNGVFKNIDQVFDFYNGGGGAARGLTIENQTLSSDSLNLTEPEIENLKSFLRTLDEQIIFQSPPSELPVSQLKQFADRKVGGEY